MNQPCAELKATTNYADDMMVKVRHAEILLVRVKQLVGIGAGELLH